MNKVGSMSAYTCMPVYERSDDIQHESYTIHGKVQREYDRCTFSVRIHPIDTATAS